MNNSCHTSTAPSWLAVSLLTIRSHLIAIPSPKPTASCRSPGAFSYLRGVEAGLQEWASLEDEQAFADL
jgi:hypothetical protein